MVIDIKNETEKIFRKPNIDVFKNEIGKIIEYILFEQELRVKIIWRIYNIR